MGIAMAMSLLIRNSNWLIAKQHVVWKGCNTCPATIGTNLTNLKHGVLRGCQVLADQTVKTFLMNEFRAQLD